MEERLHNKPKLKETRKRLRNQSTSAEAVFWRYLKSKQVGGLKFRRQYSVGNYVLDFYCVELKLAIELDGEPHCSYAGMEADNKRDTFLKNNGIHVLRFENSLVFEQPMDIVGEILKFQANR